MADENAPDEFRNTLDPAAKLCGNCRLWRVHSRDAQKGWVGDCRVMTGRGLFPPDAPVCSSFLPRASAIPTALPTAPGKRTGLISGPARHVASGPVGAVGPTIVRAGATIGAHVAPPPAPVFVASPRDHELLDMEGTTMTREEWKALIREALQEPNQVPLAPKWEGGTIILKPHDPALQAKELPLDALFRKVVMIRDRLRVLEQKVNAHPKLTDTDKVEMQQYVTRCYGSLTSFNLLFHDKKDHFIGDKSE